ncbi:MAG TPA: hypothetical protein ENJ82_11120 [Bacteroidetes bacterium]|nr:hypothetical protein [Bacteroidota bacterium]
MLDLKELERKLDLALEAETPESARAWLMAKRSKRIRAFFKKNLTRNEIASPNRFLFNDEPVSHSNVRNYISAISLEVIVSPKYSTNAPQAVEIRDKELFCAA